MKCRKCGTELRSDDEFCYHCGERTTFFQRLFASRAIVGSSIAVVVVIIAAFLTWMIMSGRLDLTALKTKIDNIQTKQENRVVVSDKEPEPPQSGQSQSGLEGVSQPAVQASEEPVEAPTPTPAPELPADVTDTEKVEMKALTDRMRPFLAFSASYYENGRHSFKWDDVSATTMALYNLYHLDKSVKYGTSFASIQKKTKKEITHLFGENARFNLKYGGYFPDYVFVKTGDTVMYNAVRIDGKEYKMKVEKIINTKENRYRVIVSAWLQQKSDKKKGYVQKYTVYVEKDESAEYGYVMRKMKLYEKKDGQVK